MMDIVWLPTVESRVLSWTPAAAEYQIPRVAKLRHMSKDQLREWIDLNTEIRQFGILSEPRVNVLKLNIALDRSQTSEQSPND